MKNKDFLKPYENKKKKKFQKIQIKKNIDNNIKNAMSSFKSGTNLHKRSENKSDVSKNKNSINLTINNNNNKLKKNLTTITDNLCSNFKNLMNLDTIRNTEVQRKSIHHLNNRININNNKKYIFNFNKEQKNNNNKLYINEIIPNEKKIKKFKNSFIRANNFNNYHLNSPHSVKLESKKSSNSQSHKNRNIKIKYNYDKDLKLFRKNKTEMNSNNNTNNTININSNKSNKNIKYENYKKKNKFSSSVEKQKRKKDFPSLLLKSTVNKNTHHIIPFLSNQIVNNNIRKKINMSELDLDLENNMSEINYTIGNLSSNDFALCNTNSSLDEIYEKLIILCKEKGLTLTKIETNKYICKKNGDNSIKIEINKRGKINMLKLYYLNGKENITKEIIKEIILRIGF